MWYMDNGAMYNSNALDNLGTLTFSKLNPVLQKAIDQTAQKHGLTVEQLTSISYVISFDGKQHRVVLHYDDGKDEYQILGIIPVKLLRRFYHAFKDKYLYPVR